ncbi:MAG: ATP-binding protein, partial [Pseudomonadota bacterium]
EGGRVLVEIRTVADGVAIEVIDNGIGIRPDDLERLGQPFEQARAEDGRDKGGTGLGLALTKSFAEMHGGRLDMASVYGEGTVMTLRLPISNANPKAKAQSVARDASLTALAVNSDAAISAD